MTKRKEKNRRWRTLERDAVMIEADLEQYTHEQKFGFIGHRTPYQKSNVRLFRNKRKSGPIVHKGTL